MQKIEPQPRERRLLGVFHDVRYLTTSQFRGGWVGTEDFGKWDVLERCLYRLKRGGYLTTVNQAHRSFSGPKRVAHRPENVWTLTNLGARVANIGFNFDKNNARLRGNDVFSHPLLISEFYVALRLGERAGEFEIIEWKGDGACELEAGVMAERGMEHHRWKPDASFTVADDAHEAPCFLEVDRGTEPLETASERRRSWWGGKVRDYSAYWFANQRPPMSVLVLAEDDKRAEDLRRTACSLDPHGKGLNIFAFISTEHWSLSDPAPLYGKRSWRTATGGRRRLFDPPRPDGPDSDAQKSILSDDLDSAGG